MPGAIYPYTFSTTTTTPPANKQVRFNNSTYASITRLSFDNDTADNNDLHDGLMQLSVGVEIAIQESGNHANLVRFAVAAAAVDQSAYVDIPVTFVEHRGTTFANNLGVDCLFYADVTPRPSPDPTPTPPLLAFTRRVELPTPLVSLDDAKEHLTVTDDDHDSKINACVLEAQNIVLDYLQAGADATWTDATLPFPVRAAIYRWLTWLYDDSRGIDERDADAAKVHKAMELLLARFRDPALA